MTPEQTDALAAWWRGVLDAQRATLTPGGPGWADLQAKLAVILAYQVVRGNGPTFYGDAELTLDALGWVMQRLAHAHHLEHPEQEGWIDSWRPES